MKNAKTDDVQVQITILTAAVLVLNSPRLGDPHLEPFGLEQLLDSVGFSSTETTQCFRLRQRISFSALGVSISLSL